MDRHQEIVARITGFISAITETDAELPPDSPFSELGLNSFHLIATLLELKSEYGLGDEWELPARMPDTVSELASLIELALPPGRTP